MKLKTSKMLVLLGSATLSMALLADDTDLFLVNNTNATSATPNVLFSLDNSANWNSILYKVDGESVTKKKAGHKALHQVLTDPRYTNAVRTGIMVFAHGNSPKGSKVIAAVKDLDTSYQTTLANKLYDSSGNELLSGTNNAPYATSLNEAYLYFSGLAPKSGTQDGDHDPDALASATQYASPAHDLTNPCAKNSIILIGNGAPDSGENTDAESLLTNLGGKYASDPLPLSPSDFESNWSDEFARYMARTDVAANQDAQQNIITYVIDVFDPENEKTKKDQAARAFLKSIAKQGKGRYFTAKNTDEIVAAINTILDEIQAVNSVFASTTLPVSVNVRGTNLNQVYMGVFRPDPQKLPRWFGNLKLYQLAFDEATNTLFLADKNGLPVESPITGFVVSDAVSFWTHDSSFWSFDPRGTPESGSDSPDGEIVEKGAASQRLRDNYPTRNLYTCTGTCTSGSLLSATPFSDGNSYITQSALAVADSTERTQLINWVRGADNKEDENSDGSTTDVRSSIHGDVLHSRPAVVNYNRTGDDSDIVAYYGANDGIFHALKGGKLDTYGYELWGFIPPELFGKLKRLRDNTQINSTNGPKPYFVDGTISVYQHDANNDGRLISADGDKVYLYLSMRRGGQFIYALDVSNPDDPKFLWKRDHNDTGYAELGQTWSEPKVAKINLNGSEKPVLIFGAGYDPAADDAEPAGTAAMGRGVFVVDALTGDVIWQAGPNPSGGSYQKIIPDMVFSIPSDVTTINLDGDISPYTDRVYAGDTGGNIWRIDIGDPDPTNWEVYKLASVGGTESNARKFLFPSDVVFSKDANGPYHAVLIGSGDREHPFDTTVINRFYMFKDRKTGFSGDGQATLTEIDLYDATNNLIQDGSDTEQATAQSELLAAKGWYITLGGGEKVVSSAITVSGTTYFNTNQPAPPDSSSCSSNLGIARNYAVSFDDATASTELNGSSGLTKADRHTTVAGGGYPPSPVPVIVEIDGKKHQAVISGIQVQTPPNTQLEVRKRVFWYKEME